MKVDILGVSIDDLGEAVVLEMISRGLEKGKKFFVATPNPEMIVLAQKNPEFKKILNLADIKIADGVGLKFGAGILGKKLNNRLAGTDLMERLCGFASLRGKKIYLLGAGRGIAKSAAENLQKKFPGLEVCGAEEGGKMDEWDSEKILEHINDRGADFLFVALGHGKQEKWIFENFKKLGSARLAMGVGGAFDFFAGQAKRAPRFMRKIGMEWFWRLATEPRRYRRMIDAVIVFPLLCVKKALLGGRE
jgi:N-acetylglucosaminyldiphosphoundecaprenol N-acetyl-beta-D-mannosaminyltransferase